MARGKRTLKKRTHNDPVYNSELLGKFINYIMERGKKSVAQTIVYGALEVLKEKTKEDPLKTFEKAIEAVKPHLEVRSKRVGGANYQVPMPVSGGRQNALAFRWIISSSRARKGRSMRMKLADELLDALEGAGGAIKKREDVHRMADANKAFAHFARFRRK